jgi:hypothetical protein
MPLAPADAEEDAVDIAAYGAAKPEFATGRSLAFPPETSRLLLKNKGRLEVVRQTGGRKAQRNKSLIAIFF